MHEGQKLAEFTEATAVDKHDNSVGGKSSETPFNPLTETPLGDNLTSAEKIGWTF